MRYERWLKCRNVDASKKNFVATGSLVFDFELFTKNHAASAGVVVDPFDYPTRDQPS
jgi:hypothetical protein